MITNKSTNDELHIVMFPHFAFGHIAPFIQLSNKLSVHGIRVSFLSSPGNIPRIQSSLLPHIQIIPVSIPSVDGLPPDLENTSKMTPAMAELLTKAVDLMQPQIKILLSKLNPHFVFLDFSQHWLPKLSSELGIKSAWFSVFSAISGAYLTVPARSANGNIPTVDELLTPPKGFPSTAVTSVKAFQATDFSYIYKSFHDNPSVFNRLLECVNSCNAVIIKTCNEMEGPYIDFMKSQLKKPILLSGPLVPESPSGELDEKWEKWLSQFPSKSVIFCSFGSETFLTHDQIHQLSLGLELTGLPFLLVLNFTSDETDPQTQLQRALPEGFMKRVENRGIIHSGWVQQPLILAHDSVGCYLNHSGFSSLIEATMNDCQLVMLPFKGDQFLNSKLLAMELKAGVEVNRRNEDGYFGKEDINEAVRKVMVDVEKDTCKAIRENHSKWRDFLLNEDIQNKFIADLAEELKALV
ncbi:anthocyanidin-3-O-glucoside rhamnosyltransferase-like [Mercurialis annua]|uniref:anthocyanidin-3-O-glucoside rhamnosyltransferase-like n=1 Tax=Mercurialis annua TaxID=3986 RepID=UPI00216044A3|nr:anthocyanidin-3-O-glucoside rhamnosyltransferase-like [Mercurialis annua]